MASEYARPGIDKDASKKERRQRQGARRMAGEAMKEEGFDRKEYREGHYDVDKLDNFNLRATGSGSAMGKEGSKNEGKGRATAKLSRQDIRGLASSGEFSGKQLERYVGRLDKRAESGEDVKVGSGARNFLEKFKANQQAKKDEGKSGGDKTGGGGNDGGGTTPAPAPAPTATPAPTPTPTPTASSGGGGGGGASVKNVINQQKKFAGDNKNTVGGNNYGNLGNQDFSVNIQGGGRNGLNNMASSASYNALNENQYQKSKALYDPDASAAANIENVKATTGVDDFIESVDYLTQQGINNYKDEATKSKLGVFGDYFNYEVPEWQGGYQN